MIEEEKKEKIDLSFEEYVEIAKHFEEFNSVFSKFWQLGKPRFTEDIETAAINFDEQGNCIEFIFNPVFWNTIIPYQRIFVIAHECLHVVLEHGKRWDKTNSKQDHMINNIAADLVVNHLLVDKFLMDKQIIDPDNNFYWIENTFEKPELILRDQNFEYYRNILYEELKQYEEDLEQGDGNGEKGEGEGRQNPLEGKELVDSHEHLKDIPNEKIIEEMFQNVSKEELMDLIEKGGQLAGTHAGNLIKEMSKEKVRKKKKWETIIKKWSSKYIKQHEKISEQWLRMNRRTINMPEDIVLPSEMEIEETTVEKERIEVSFFLDTSGSCSHLAERFWKAAKTLPENKFKINLFCFDTSVYEVNIKDGRLYGFGGTYFHIIEEYIQNDIAKNVRKYPEAVFIITDGYGNPVNPKFPKRWYWFLSYDYRQCIPAACKIYNLCDFE